MRITSVLQFAISVRFSKFSPKKSDSGPSSKLILPSGAEVTNTPTIARLLARKNPELYSDDLLTSSEIDHFCRVGQKLNFERDARILNDSLLLRTFLTGKQVSVADFLLWAYLRDSKQWNELTDKDKFVNLNRWYGHIGSMKQIKESIFDFFYSFFLVF